MFHKRFFTILNFVLAPVLIGLIVYYGFFKDIRAALGIFIVLLYFILFALITITVKRFHFRLQGIGSVLIVIPLILLAECGIAYAFYLFAISKPLFFAISTIALFLSLIIIMIRSHFHERIKVETKEVVSKHYLSVFKTIIFLSIGSFVLIVFIKAGILVVKNVF